MSRNTKIIVGVVASILLLCACIGIVGVSALGTLGIAIARTVDSNPAKAEQVAGQIADFQLPSGYHAEASVQVAGYSFVSYSPGDNHSHIMLVQAPASFGVTQADLEQYAAQANPNTRYSRNQVHVVGKSAARIRGQDVTLVISEGTNNASQPYRTLTGVFQGKGGPALVSVESPISSWNQAEADAFIASIR